MKLVIMTIAALILISCSKPTGPDDLLNPVSTVVKQAVKGAIKQ
jgi:hypothetical protein